jgi:tRNA (mo5U34)-methyltransferase
MNLNNATIQELIDSVPVWHHRIEVAPGVITPGLQWTQEMLEDIGLPEDLTGLRVLDLGARDGFFSFECERRGASEVIAVDYSPAELTGFNVAKAILDSKVKWITANVYKINQLNLGKFDLVLFLGVIYHLRNPYLAIDRIYDVLNTGGKIIVESHIINGGFVDEQGNWIDLKEINPRLQDLRIAQIYKTGELSGDITSPWAPTINTLEIMFENSGFLINSSWEKEFRGGLTATSFQIDENHPRYLDSSSEANPNSSDILLSRDEL